MLTTLVAALSLVSSLTIDVPYLPQTDALCGGAAAAMVFRYWGDAHADVQEFAPLVDRRAGGIANNILTSAVQARGWRTERSDGSIEALTARVRDGQPVIVLLPDRGLLYHYVVVVGASAEAIVVHDPAWGPSRTILRPAFERAWKAAESWSLVILPPVSRHTSSPEPTVNLSDTRTDSWALAELSGVRFAERRWSDAAALARDALTLDRRDTYALDVLGSSLFMQDEAVGALRAWNQLDKPRVNRVRISGLHRTRYQTVAEVMAIQPNMLLTADVFERARRRLNELPDQTATRLDVRPETDGFATVEVGVAELAPVPRGAVEWIGAVARTAANREIAVAAPGISGQGEVWSANWRWWSHRPAVGISFAAPRVRGLPGVWRFEGSWQSDTYGGADATRLVDTRTRGALTISDWLSGHVRYSVTTGLDAWSAGRKAASFGGALERVEFEDRLSLSIDATQWAPLTGGASFGAIAARAVARSSTNTRGWVTRGAIGVERVSDAAPFSVWPGAGEGQVRAPLLRAHPLLSDGVVDLTASSAFGRTLLFGSGEVQRWFARPSLVRLGIAGFTDIARASRQADAGATGVQVDLGAGLRIKIPGTPGVLRADIAHGVRDGRNALTFGWLY